MAPARALGRPYLKQAPDFSWSLVDVLHGAALLLSPPLSPLRVSPALMILVAVCGCVCVGGWVRGWVRVCVCDCLCETSESLSVDKWIGLDEVETETQKQRSRQKVCVCVCLCVRGRN